MKKFVFISLLSAAFTVAHAQLNGDGYYRIQNTHTGRYISIVNSKVDAQNKDIWKVANTGSHIYALKTSKPMSEVVSDPGSIIYIANAGDGYVLRGQGLDTKELTGGRYLKIYNSRTVTGAYWLYASESGTSIYLKDTDDVLDYTGNTGYALASTSRSVPEVDWNILPIDHENQYLGIMPEFSVGNKHYATMYAGFPFSLSDGMKAYYVKTMDDGMAVLAEIDGIIPAGTPVIIECSSADPKDNKVILQTGQYAAVQNNLLKGIYFSYVMQSVKGGEATNDVAKQLRNVVSYDEETMRVLGVVDGELALVKASDMVYLPANKVYVPVSSSAADNVKLVDEDTFANSIRKVEGGVESRMSVQGVFTVAGVRVRSNSSTEGLPSGMYIVDGKKVIVK